MYTFNAILLLLLAITTPLITASPIESSLLNTRANKSVNPAAVRGTKCTNPSVKIIFHDENVAQLAICGSIAGAITKCQGAPLSTTGSSGTAKFSLAPTTKGATINVSKGRWEGCIRAARAVCPTGEFKSTCVGGASKGDIGFSLVGN